MSKYTTANICEGCQQRLLDEHDMEFAGFSIQAGEDPCVFCGELCGYVWPGFKSKHAPGGVFSIPESCVDRVKQKLGFA